MDPRLKKQKTEYNAAIGDALGRWARVEWELCRVFCKSVNARKSEAAIKAF